MISTKRATGSNDNVSIIDPVTLLLGPLAGVANPNTITPTTFTIPLSVFSSGWANGDTLDLSLTTNNVSAITMVESVFTMDYTNGSAPPPPVPEPATALLLGVGLAGAAFMHKRFKRPAK